MTTHADTLAAVEKYGPRDWIVLIPLDAYGDHDRIAALTRADVTTHGWELANPDDDPEVSEVRTATSTGPVAIHASIRVRRPRGHLLHIAPSADWHPDQHAWDIEVTCLNPLRCDGWWECLEDHEQDGISAADGPWESDEDAPWLEEEEWDFHGVTHTWRYGHGWTVPYPGCVVAVNDDVRDQGWWIAEEHGAGVYAVEDDWDDEFVALHYLRPATPEEIAR